MLGYLPSEYVVKLGDRIETHTPQPGMPEIPENALVMVGVGEDRGAENNAGCADAPDEIRRYLYQLAVPNTDTHIVDLGNVIIGQTAEDTSYAVAEIVRMTGWSNGGVRQKVLTSVRTLGELGGEKEIHSSCSAGARTSPMPPTKATSGSTAS